MVTITSEAKEMIEKKGNEITLKVVRTDGG